MIAAMRTLAFSSLIPVLVALSFSAPAQAKTKARSLLVLPFSANGVEEETAKTITSLTTVELDRWRELKVLSGADVQNFLELESNKTAAGCTDESCLAEIAGALGAEWVVSGEVGQLGRRLVVTLNLFDAVKKEAVNRVTVKADDIERMPEALEREIPKLVAPALGRHGGPPAPEIPRAPSSSPNLFPWFMLGAGGLSACGCCAFGLVPTVYWIEGEDARNQLAKQERDFDPDTSNPREIGSLRYLLDDSATEWNSFGIYWFYLFVGAAVVAGGVATTGLVWGLAE
jgi:TolB-like protein